MDKQKLIQYLSLVAKMASMVAGLAAYSNYLPQKYLPIAALVFGGASILKDCINRFEDLVDDGTINGSINKPK